MSDSKNPLLDGSTTQLQAEIVANLTESDIETLDGLLIANIDDVWLKTAFVIGGVMLKVPDEYEEVPEAFYAERLSVLKDKGLIVVKGDLSKMKDCEIQLA